MERWYGKRNGEQVGHVGYMGRGGANDGELGRRSKNQVEGRYGWMDERDMEKEK